MLGALLGAVKAGQLDLRLGVGGMASIVEVMPLTLRSPSVGVWLGFFQRLEEISALVLRLLGLDLAVEVLQGLLQGLTECNTAGICYQNGRWCLPRRTCAAMSGEMHARWPIPIHRAVKTALAFVIPA
jgi:hypothetical protein